MFTNGGYCKKGFVNLLRARVEQTEHALTSFRQLPAAADVMKEEVVTISPEASWADAAKVMSEQGVSCLVVVENGQIRGIVTETDFLKRAAAKQNEAEMIRVKDYMTVPVITVEEDAKVLEAADVIEQHKIKRLPVSEGGRLVGIITQTDMIRLMTSYGMWRGVEQVMSEDVATARGDSCVADVASFMSERGISCVLVMNGERVEGVFTERDLFKRVISKGRNCCEVRIDEVMSVPVLSVNCNLSVFSASRMMEEKNVRRLAVMEDDRLRGIVTQTDIFKAVGGKLREEERGNMELLGCSGSGVVTLDTECRIAYINPSFMELLELSEGEDLRGSVFLPERFWFDMEDRKQFLEGLKRGEKGVKDLTLKTSNGKRVNISGYFTSTADIHHRCNGYQGVVEDKTWKVEVEALRETEARLRESEQRYRRLTEAVTDYIYTVHFENGEATKTVHSESSVAVTGYRPEELCRQPRLWIEMVHPEDRKAVYRQVDDCINGRGVEALKHRIIRKEGQTRWVRSTLVGNFDLHGQILSYDGLLKDITESKLAEEEVVIKHALLEAVSETSIDGILVVDPEGKILLSNGRFAQMWSLPSDALESGDDDVLLANFFEQLEDPDGFLERVRFLYHNRGNKSRDEIRFKDGKVFDRYSAPLADPGGRYYGRIWYFRDITEQKQTEVKIKNHQQLLSNVLAHIPNHVFWKDRDSRYLGCNENFSKAAGLSGPEEVVGKTDYDLPWTKEQSDWYLKCDREVIESGKSIINMEEEQLQAGGKVATALTSKVPLRDANGDIIGVLGIYADISSRKRAEEELRNSKEQAEKARLELERVNFQLKETYNKLMETSHRAGMAEVATDVLHNVGNVLNSINVSAELISERLAESEVSNFSKVAEMLESHRSDMANFLAEDSRGRHIPRYLAEAARKLSTERENIIGKLKNLGKNVEHIKNVVKMQQLYAKASGVMVSAMLEEVIEDAIEINQSGLERHEIKLVREYCELGELQLDRQRVLQILVNLISNAKYALKYKEGERILKIRSWKQGEDKVRVEVTDTGIGIHNRNLTKIFRHGFTTKRNGHGFGLHSSALAAEEMGGWLKGYSDGPGRGAVFTLELPYRPSRVEQCVK